MKTFYSPKKMLVTAFVFFLLSVFNQNIAQTTLYAGDVAFVGAQCTTGQADTFVMVLLKDIAASTEIGFTDGSWQDTGSKFFLVSNKVDWVFFWQASTNLHAGDTVKFYTSSTADNVQGGPAYATSGTITGGCGLNLKSTGDQIFAFQGLDAIDTATNYYVDPTRVLAGIHMNVNFATTDANWDDGTNGLQQSELPDSLVTGVSAIRLYTGTNTEVIDGYLSTYILSLDKTVINNLNNWTRANTTYSPAIPARVVWDGSSWSGTTSSTMPAVIASGTSPSSGFNCSDLRVNGSYSFNIGSGKAFHVYGDLYNYGGDFSGTGNLYFNTSDTARLYGNATNFKGIIWVATGAVLVTNDLLTLNADNSGFYGQIGGSGSYLGSISGNITAKYYIGGSTSGWRTMCSPVDGATLAQLDDDIPLYFSTPDPRYANVFTFDESGSSPHWNYATGTSQSMDNGTFGVYIRASQLPLTLDITGTYHGTSDYTLSGLTYTGSTTDTSGWHFIRNPWPTSFYWDGSISNIQGAAAYIYDQASGTYTTFDNIFDGIIPPFTAIAVQVSSNNVSVTLPNNYRNVAYATNYFDKTITVNNYVALTVKNLETGITDVARFYTDGSASNAFDILDGSKKMNDPMAPSIYFTSSGKNLYKEVWQDIPEKGIDLPVSISTQDYGAYQLVADMQNIELGTQVYLEDMLNHKLYDISKGSCNFNVDSGDIAGRFVLHIRKSAVNTGVKSVDDAHYFIGSSGSSISIGATLSGPANIEVTDLLGRTLLQTTLSLQAGQSAILPVEQPAAGYYIVKVSGDSAISTQKVYLK